MSLASLLELLAVVLPLSLGGVPRFGPGQVFCGARRKIVKLRPTVLARFIRELQ
jgi:hypothetical protein